MLTPCPNPIVQEDSSGGEAHRVRYRLQAGVVVSLLHACWWLCPSRAWSSPAY